LPGKLLVFDLTLIAHNTRELGFGLGGNEPVRSNPLVILITYFLAINADWEKTVDLHLKLTQDLHLILTRPDRPIMA
jgi:hypothetical protein